MPARPNIVFLLPDQLRADFLSCYGARFIHTPHIDALADGGTLYRHAYSASPVCVPARVSIMTGMNAIKNGVLDNAHFISPDRARSGVRTWPEILNGAGYYTAAIGKMHFYPWEASLGFRQRIIAEDKIWIHIDDDYARMLAAHGLHKTVGNDKPEYHANHGAFVSDIPWELSVDRFVGQQACQFLRDYRRPEPFAIMAGFPGPHNPYDPSKEFADRFDPANMPVPIPGTGAPSPEGAGTGGRRSWYAIENSEFHEGHMRTMRARYAALVAQIDHEVGCIMEALRERGVLDNTLVLLSSDHGDYLGDHGLTGKNSFYEAATHVPMIARVPGAVGRQEYTGLVELADITATMLCHAGCEVPAWMDAMPLPASGCEATTQRERIVGMLASGWMIYDGTWKLCKYANGQTQLFNRASDPDELRNLAMEPQCAEVLARLDGELTREIMRSVRSGCYDRRVMAGSLSHSDEFGAFGWQRPWPGHVEH